jgi:uncharacterized membrane protein
MPNFSKDAVPYAVGGGENEAEKQNGAPDVAAGDAEDMLVLDVADEDMLLNPAATHGVVDDPVVENLSDLDEKELEQYLCTEEEVKMKKQIWMVSNKCACASCLIAQMLLQLFAERCKPLLHLRVLLLCSAS